MTPPDHFNQHHDAAPAGIVSGQEGMHMTTKVLSARKTLKLLMDEYNDNARAAGYWKNVKGVADPSFKSCGAAASTLNGIVGKLFVAGADFTLDYVETTYCDAQFGYYQMNMIEEAHHE